MDVKEIKQRLSINQVLGYYNLKPDKNQRLVCPFHADKTPSLQIYPATNTYCCFSSNCTAGTGDAIQFIERKENCTKHEALVKAAAMIRGDTITPLPAGKLFIEPASTANVGQELERIAVLTKAFKVFSKALPLTKQGVAYLQGRGLDYKLGEVGFISDRYHHVLAKEFLSSCVKVGLLRALPVQGYSIWV
jgi:DNA primase